MTGYQFSASLAVRKKSRFLSTSRLSGNPDVCVIRFGIETRAAMSGCLNSGKNLDSLSSTESFPSS